MEKKFAQGEWFAKEGNIYQIETGKTLAILPYFDQENEEQEANSKLMAAAPELLIELMNAVTTIEKLLSISNMSKSNKAIYMREVLEHETAIRKATE